MTTPSHPHRTIQAATLEHELVFGDLGACLARWEPRLERWMFVPLAPLVLGSLALALGLPAAHTCGAALAGLVLGSFAVRQLAAPCVGVHERGLRIAGAREVRWFSILRLEERAHADGQGRVAATDLRVWFGEGESIELREPGQGAPDGPIAAVRRMAEPWVRRNARRPRTGWR